MIMTSSPMLHTPTHPHSPHLSPGPSPALRPMSSLHLKTSSPSSSTGSGSITPLAPLPPSTFSSTSTCTVSPASASASPQAHRSYARAPTQRPYQSPRAARAGVSARGVKEVEGDTKAFAELVAGLVEKRACDAGGEAGVEGDEKRKGRSLGGNMAGSWEVERAELIVDIPVWSPGCFQDLSTLHALRDTTLSHTHSLLAYLLRTHSIPATYRLLARSTAAAPHTSTQHTGWGCIRLAPSVTSPIVPKRELKPKYRRTSFVHEKHVHDRDHGHDMRAETKGRGRSRTTEVLVHVPTAEIPPIAQPPALASPVNVTPSTRTQPKSGIPRTPEMVFEQALGDESDDDEDDTEGDVRLKERYRSSSGSDEEDEEESADVLVAREVERRGAREGSAFLMTLFGGPALILT